MILKKELSELHASQSANDVRLQNFCSSAEAIAQAPPPNILQEQVKYDMIKIPFVRVRITRNLILAFNLLSQAILIIFTCDKININIIIIIILILFSSSLKFFKTFSDKPNCICILLSSI